MSDPPEGMGRGRGRGRGAAIMEICRQKKEQDAAMAAAAAAAAAATEASAASTSSRRVEAASAEAASAEAASASTSRYASRGSLSLSTVSSVPTQQMEGLEIKKERGIEGQPIPLIVNCIPMKIQEGKGLFEYAVTFNPGQDSRSFQYKLMHQHVEFLGPERTFDGGKLYLPRKLESTVTTLNGVHPIDESPVEITIKFIRQHKLSECIHHFNVLFRRIMRMMELVPIGRNMYNPKSSISISNWNLELWPGFVTAIHEFDGGLMLLAEVASRVIRTETVLDVMADIQRQYRGEYKDECTRQIIGTTILTRYNNNTYRVDDINWNENPTSTFTDSAGESCTYIDYYNKTYGIKIQDIRQPLLVNKEVKRGKNTNVDSGVAKMRCMIPELCYTTGLTDGMRKNFNLMKDVSMNTRIPPNIRRLHLTNFVRDIYKCEKAKKLLDGWGIEICLDLLETEGRVFKSENIVVGGRKTISAGMKADWGREVVNFPSLKVVDLSNWAVLYVRKDDSKVRGFLDMMVNVSRPMGIIVRSPERVVLPDDRNQTLSEFLKRSIRSQIQLILVVSPSRRDDRYNMIKKICCVDRPVPSQVVNASTISNERKLRSITQKILLQINCKLGGELWGVTIPLTKLMIIGIDTYHDTTLGNKSVMGFVFSVNDTHTCWSSQCRFQTRGEELGTTLNTFMVFALKKYYEVRHCLPERIVVFRDGVSDGQLGHVESYEVQQIKSAFQSYGDSYTPLLTFIVVQKRINTKFFAVQARQNLENPPPGTVVDHTVTPKNWQNFFLVSQHVTQGTVTPTHYIVVYNNNSSLKVDYIQKLAFKMTHMYYNWPGTIRVPAPCQYAHKLASLVGMNIKTEPSKILTDRLFFL